MAPRFTPVRARAQYISHMYHIPLSYHSSALPVRAGIRHKCTEQRHNAFKCPCAGAAKLWQDNAEAAKERSDERTTGGDALR